MLINLLSTSNYISFNSDVAHKLGLHTAIHISELLNIYEKAIRKNKIKNIDEEAFFTVDRKYLQERSTLTAEEQKQIENDLCKLGILKTFGNCNTLNINLQTLFGFGAIDTESIQTQLDKVSSTKPKSTKKDAIINNLKTYIYTTNPELRCAYEEWIESVYSKQGWMSKQSVTTAEKVIDDFCNHDLDLALTIINIASMGGFRDMQWAVNSYVQDKERNSKLLKNQPTQKTCNSLTGGDY